MKRLLLLPALLLLAGCGDSSPPPRPAPPPRPSPPPAPPRPKTPEEAMELEIAKPLAASVEHWIADTDLGDAWKQAKENVAGLRGRLVADYRARQESGVGETPASMALRKDYDHWISVHDRLKAFILDCRASGAVRELPPDLAANFKDYAALRRELLRDAPGSLDGLDAGLADLRDNFAALRDSTEPTEARFAAAEALDARVAALRAKADGLRAGSDEIARRYATDEAVAALAERAAKAASEAKDLATGMAALRGKLHDAETVRLFEERVAAFERGLDRLDELVAAKARREAEAQALSAALADDIREKRFAGLPERRAKLASLRGAAAAVRPAETECALAVKAVAKDFAGTLGAKSVRALRQNLVSADSAARIAALSQRAETAVARHGKTIDAALLNLQNTAFKLEDGAAETAALAEAEKRLARLDALSKR